LNTSFKWGESQETIEGMARQAKVLITIMSRGGKEVTGSKHILGEKRATPGKGN